MLPDEPELPELPERPDDPDEPDDPDDPDEPEEALRPDCPLPLEPDIPLERSLLERSLLERSLLEPDIPPERSLLLEPDMPPEFSLLPEDGLLRSRFCDELDELPLMPLERSDDEPLDALRAPPCELDDPELPPTPPVLEPLDEECRSRSDAE